MSNIDLLKICPNCSCDELFVRKNFPQKIGLSIVAVAAVSFLVLATWRQSFWIGVGVLIVATLIDALLYCVVGRVTVCYRCRSEFSGPVNPAHGGFDLAVGEKYRHG